MILPRIIFHRAEGCGTCNGINYTYTATSKAWYGDCKVCPRQTVERCVKSASLSSSVRYTDTFYQRGPKSLTRRTSPLPVVNGQYLYRSLLFVMTLVSSRQLIFTHTKDGLFGISLLSIGNSSVRIQYSVSVLNSADPEKNIDNCGARTAYLCWSAVEVHGRQ